MRDLAAVGTGAGHGEFVEADLRFHRVLVKAVGSPWLTRLYQALSGEIHLSTPSVSSSIEWPLEPADGRKAASGRTW